MRHYGYGSLALALGDSLEALAHAGPRFAMPGDQPRYAPTARRISAIPISPSRSISTKSASTAS